ncbi:hypothetical protein TWF506_004766 [Arthrobotrys conoides]|uniref:Uncharacterized protein n=1 Tax=Arthrobotrys conoides TaxID=74498 RepID=A0AAN8MWI8_9PEZI
MLPRAFLILSQMVALRVHGTLALATFLEGFFATNGSPLSGQVYELCYGVRSMENVVSLANKATTTCEHLRGLSFWQAQRETSTQGLDPDFEYFSFDTIGGQSMLVTEGKSSASLKVGKVGEDSRLQKALFSNMIPKSIAGGSRGLRPQDNLILVGSLKSQGNYKLQGNTGKGNEPRVVAYSAKGPINSKTMTLRVAPNPEQVGQVNLPIYEESDESDTSERIGVPTLNPDTGAWEWTKRDRNIPDTPSESTEEDIDYEEFSPEDSDAFIEQADWSTAGKRQDFTLNPPAILPNDPSRLPAGFRYPQTASEGNNPEPEEILQISDVQISPYQDSEETSRLLAESDINDRLFMNSPEEMTLDTSGSQLNLGSVSYTPTAYGNDISEGFGDVVTPQLWTPPQGIGSNQRQSAKSNSGQPLLSKSGARRKAGSTRPILAWPSNGEDNGS